MEKQFMSGKSALVTGATRGIGLAVARLLSAHGATVYVTGRSIAPVESFPGPVKAYRLDHSDHQAFDEILTQICEEARLDVAVLNVGYLAPFNNLEDSLEKDLDQTLSINFK